MSPLRLPKHAERQLDSVEWLGSYDCVVFVGVEEQPAPTLEPIDLERARDWVDDPDVPYAFAAIDAAPGNPIAVADARASTTQ